MKTKLVLFVVAVFSLTAQASFDFEGEGVSLSVSVPIQRVFFKKPVTMLNGDKISIMLSKQPYPYISANTNQLMDGCIRFLKQLKEQKKLSVNKTSFCQWNLADSKFASVEVITQNPEGVQKMSFVLAGAQSSIYQFTIISDDTNVSPKEIIRKFQLTAE